ncbi:MAG: ribosomal RNA small subunit methyltransferase A [Chloroflexi bacterium]|nr:ribosomal RNA small subunit methyltransferase A [Chloroflexota bacterium]
MSKIPTLPPGADWPGPSRQLHDLSLRPKRRLSQSFLTSRAIAAAMVEAAEVGPADVVLEVGPGLGILTRELLGAAGKVVSVEIDPQLAAALPGALDSPENLQVVVGDATRLDFGIFLVDPYLAVASLPYHVATPILFRWGFELPRPERIVVMLQEEVARRIVAAPGAMNFLAVALSTVASARIVRRVPPGAFFPVPKVHSAIVRLDIRETGAVAFDRAQHLVTFLRAGFTQPRRQLHNSLALGLGKPSDAVHLLVTAEGFDPTRRPSELSLEEWVVLYKSALNAGWLAA